MSSEGKHEVGWQAYYLIFNVLILLTLTTVAISYVNFVNHAGNIIAAMVVAVIKASLVVVFFMHMKYEGRLNRFTAIFALSLFGLAVTVFCTDFIFLGTYENSHQVGKLLHHAAAAAMGAE
jgi:cytochrome c oxidase subunit 4